MQHFSHKLKIQRKPYFSNFRHSGKMSAFILWRLDPLLGNDLETNKETTTIPMQLRSKHVSTKTELLVEMVFLYDPCREVVVS
jgi:hypothetical protein